MMSKRHLLLKQAVMKQLSDSTHDMSHTMRVYRMCMTLAESESDVDLDILKSAAILHDVARVLEDTCKTEDIDHAVVGARMSERFLHDIGYSKKEIQQITHCIETHRFRSNNNPLTIEAKILFDADKIDILGAVGIARAFFFAGKYREKMYSESNIDEYIKSNLTGGVITGRIKDYTLHTPNIEFQIKCLHIPNRLFTKKGKLIAKERLSYVARFFDRLKDEMGVSSDE